MITCVLTVRLRQSGPLATRYVAFAALLTDGVFPHNTTIA
ncbi:hypothetical protein BIFGAL_04333 [Bifidobacterium gallicum DSM 20093 = LMG 11596]|uniref:Uncharacterized protein n=1 Tax=Bifidobacterium gallicum DSM 20093 = LMG 11596 TaxID=561180 RepID=D1NWS7_9BIFI|nr:hypothetical protein BIFGAL_04333 [Bifidobacterium gallicum DSM 20093 = LMG 11596]